MAGSKNLGCLCVPEDPAEKRWPVQLYQDQERGGNNPNKELNETGEVNQHNNHYTHAEAGQGEEV